MASRIAPSGFLVDLDRGTVQAARTILSGYCDLAEVRYAALLEESGVVCADAGDPAYRDSGETGAIAAGAFAAVREVARRLGETNFEGLCHEGKSLHFYLSPVDQQFVLLSVFGNETRIGIVRTCASQAAARLREPLALAAAASPVAPSEEETGDGESAGDFSLPADCFLDNGG